MRYARIYPWRRTRRFRAPSNGPEAFFVAQFSAGYTTNMFGFDLRQGQAEVLVATLRDRWEILYREQGRGQRLQPGRSLRCCAAGGLRCFVFSPLLVARQPYWKPK